MEFYILKSSVCLAIFYGFYKFLLEKESVHHFKRFYLLASILLAFGIPLITFTEYIEVETYLTTVPQLIPELTNNTETPIEITKTNYLFIVLWSVYGLGVLVFSLKFIKNILNLITKIKRNPKYKISHITNVLIQDLIVPHTFFNYIFLNKHKFETQQIPEEVLLHEETHAKQKHSLDILCVEVLQIIFWFNPLIYFIKHSIQLNHEFLADQAVLNQGFITSKYQQVLLAFSSNASEPQLAHAINYSSIKKRFTVMKTQTSKQAFWFRSFILLPLLAILIYGFSEKTIVEKEALNINKTEKETIQITIENENEIWFENNRIKLDELAKKLQTRIKHEIDLNNVKVEITTSGTIYSTFVVKLEKEIMSAGINEIIVMAKKLIIHENDFMSQNKHKALFEVGSLLLREKNTGITIRIKQNGEILVNDKLTMIEDLKNRLDEIYKTSSYNDKTSINLHVTTHTSKENINRVKNVLRTYGILKINYSETLISESTQLTPKMSAEYSTMIKELKAQPNNERTDKLEGTLYGLNNFIKFINKTNKIEFVEAIEAPIALSVQQKATSEQIAEYNKLARKIKSNPKGVFKEKDIKRIISIYNLMSKEQKQNAELIPSFTLPPSIPENATIEQRKEYEKAIQNFRELTKGLKVIEVEKNFKTPIPINFDGSVAPTQQKATPEQIAEYNTIVKKLMAQSEHKRIIKQKDVNRIKYIYSIITDAQKKYAEDFPKLVPPPPPAMDTIYTYNRLAKRVQTISKNRKANMVYLKKLYSKMSNIQKSKVSSPENILKTIKEEIIEIAPLSISANTAPEQQKNIKATDSLAFNTLTAPDNKEIEIVLSDGTKVHLGKKSKLKYPTKFIKGQIRKVELEGEAYFEVDSSNEYYNSSFIVIANGKEINVAEEN